MLANPIFTKIITLTYSIFLDKQRRGKIRMVHYLDEGCCSYIGNVYSQESYRRNREMALWESLFCLKLFLLLGISPGVLRHKIVYDKSMYIMINKFLQKLLIRKVRRLLVCIAKFQNYFVSFVNNLICP